MAASNLTRMARMLSVVPQEERCNEPAMVRAPYGAGQACLRTACQNHSANPQFSSKLHVQTS